MQRQPDLAGELGQHAVLLFGEGGVAFRARDTMRPSSSPECTNGATRTTRSRARRARPGATPASTRCPRRAARAMTSTSSAATGTRRGPAFGHRRRPLERPVGARPDLGRLSRSDRCSDSASCRSNSSSGDGARHARAERLQGFVGRALAAVDPRFANSASRSRDGTYASAAMAAAIIDRPSTRRCAWSGASPKPSTTSEVDDTDHHDDAARLDRAARAGGRRATRERVERSEHEARAARRARRRPPRRRCRSGHPSSESSEPRRARERRDTTTPHATHCRPGPVDDRRTPVLRPGTRRGRDEHDRHADEQHRGGQRVARGDRGRDGTTGRAAATTTARRTRDARLSRRRVSTTRRRDPERANHGSDHDDGCRVSARARRRRVRRRGIPTRSGRRACARCGRRPPATSSLCVTMMIV